MKVSIDVGSGFTKYKTDDIEGSIPSIVSLNNKRLFMDDKEDSISFNDKSYLVGDSALRSSECSDRSKTLSLDWSASDGWLALLYSALSRVGAYGKIDLVIGLPQAIYIDKHKHVVEQLNRTHIFSDSGDKHTVEINAVAVPQATGALFHQAAQNIDLLDDQVGMIDVGTYTTGFSVLDRSRINHSKTGGCEVGVHQLLEQVRLFLIDKYQYSEDIAAIPDIIMSGQIRYRGKFIDIKDRIDELTLKVSTPMVDQVNRAWKGGNQLSIFVAGGGAPYFLKAIQEKMPHAIIVDDGFYAVVRGMLAYLNEISD